jgi:hypothetical protein
MEGLMMGSSGNGSMTGSDLNSILNTVMGVITNPVGFFRDMPKSGGFVPPLIFAVVMGVAAGVVRAILGILGIGFAGSFFMAIMLIVITPILVAIFGFVGAAIMFFIWRLMGSQESFETAYRCGAYATAISPITSLLYLIPYLGSLVGLVWMMYLLVIASIEVHNIAARTAWIVFGSLCALFAILTLWSEHSTRNLANRMGQFQKQLQKTEEMSPEEAGKAVGEFLKGLQKGTDNKK